MVFHLGADMKRNCTSNFRIGIMVALAISWGAKEIIKDLGLKMWDHKQFYQLLSLHD
jgi:hypothetical protein